ncbi:hypothetical protein QYF61_024449, partial [Mycteria americana]
MIFPGIEVRLTGPDYTPCLTFIPQDCKLHQCTITAAQAASSLDVTDELTCIGDHQVQYRIPSEVAVYTVKREMEVLRDFDSCAGDANWELYVITTPVICITPLLNIKNNKKQNYNNSEAEVIIMGTAFPSVQFSLNLHSSSKLIPLRTTESEATCTKIQVYT